MTRRPATAAPAVAARLAAAFAVAARLAAALAVAARLAAVLLALLLGEGGAFALAAVPAPAVDANGQLVDAGLQSRFESITHELRCLVCQNESIADSNVELAADLRRQVREMLVAGGSDEAIFKYMTDRYGDFVRFRPAVEEKTLLIWGAPFIALLLGGAVVYRVTRARSRMPLDDEPAPGPS